MTVVKPLDPLCYKMPLQGSPLFLGHKGRTATCRLPIIQESVKCLSSVHPKANFIEARINRRIGTLRQDTTACFEARANANGYLQMSNRHSARHPIRYCLNPESSKRHQRSLESYLGEVRREADQVNSTQSNELKENMGTKPLYSDDIKESGRDEIVRAYRSSASARNFADVAEYSVDVEPTGTHFRTVKLSVSSHSGKRKRSSEIEQINDESSDLYIVSILSSINIAVFLFEVASPIKNSDYNLYSIPLLYGAKVNELILIGEWWRLVTPMFLHSGFFHVALSCWVLWDFGPRVSRGYGSFTFFLLYVIGGISGTLISFLHTTEPTVGGSGPSFAIVGAWLIYQLQNKDSIPKEVSEKMFRKAVIATTLSFGLANFGLVDSWTFLGAAFTGIFYGFLTCPAVQLDDVYSDATRNEGITLFRRHADPCRSLGIFALFVIGLSSLLYFLDPPFEASELEDLFLMTE